MSLTDEEKEDCKNNLFYQYNKDYVDSMCDFKNDVKRRRRRRRNNVSFEKKCLLEDYFKENM